MEKSDITRGMIHNNFLKKIIIRFDYEGMDDSELDKVILDISAEIKKDGYVQRSVESARELEISIDDPESLDPDGMYRKNVKEQKVFVFRNQNPQVKLQISASCACITIKDSRYVDCLIYCRMLCRLMAKISELVPFFVFRRFGIRKINQCYLNDIDRLNEYFEHAHYHLFRLSGRPDTKNKIMQLKDSFEIEDMNINLIRTVIKGEIQGEEAYQINYDTDIYLIEPERIDMLIADDSKVTHMNELLFELYKDGVTIEFLEQLIDGSFDSNIILGVEANEDKSEDSV